MVSGAFRCFLRKLLGDIKGDFQFLAAIYFLPMAEPIDPNANSADPNANSRTLTPGQDFKSGTPIQDQQERTDRDDRSPSPPSDEDDTHRRRGPDDPQPRVPPSRQSLPTHLDLSHFLNTS